MTLAAPIFWFSVLLVVYAYALFPLLVILRGRLFPRPVAAGTPAIGTLDLVVAAFNEAASIGAKIDNTLGLDHPAARLRLLVASDGSTDGTVDIVRSRADRGVELLDLPRGGKSQALNRAVAASSGDVIVFTDANSMLEPRALAALLAPFADPEVGGVAGNQVYRRSPVAALSDSGERGHWNLDRLLKTHLSRAGSVTSSTGALHAIRREAFEPVPEGVTDDFFISTGVIKRRLRLVFAPEAVAIEPVASSSRREFGRKTRYISRGLYAVWLRRELLIPFRHGFYALQLFSHKVLRRLVVLPLVAIALSTAFLLDAGPVYRLAAAAQSLVYGLALAGVVLSGTRLGRLKVFALPFYFCLVNAACLVAAWNLVRGRRVQHWEPRH